MEPTMILYDESLNEGLLEFGIQIGFQFFQKIIDQAALGGTIQKVKVLLDGTSARIRCLSVIPSKSPSHFVAIPKSDSRAKEGVVDMPVNTKTVKIKASAPVYMISAFIIKFNAIAITLDTLVRLSRLQTVEIRAVLFLYLLFPE